MQNRFMHFLHIYVAKAVLAAFCRENDSRTLSGKFLRVIFCRPESFDFLCLCSPIGGCPNGGSLIGGSPIGGSPIGDSPIGGSPSPIGFSPNGGSPIGGSPIGGSPNGG